VLSYSKKTGLLMKAERRRPDGSTVLSFTVDDVKLNQPTPAGAFEFKPPPGVQVLDW